MASSARQLALVALIVSTCCISWSSCMYWKTPEKSCRKCEWKVVFKVIARNGRNVFQDYINPGGINDQIPTASDPSTNTPFRDTLLDRWNNLDMFTTIKEVKVQVFKQGQSMVTLRFDAVGSSFQNWFSQERLISSPYKSLKTASLPFGDIEGQTAGNRRRRFFFTEVTNTGCSNVCGYLVVVDNDSGTACSWETGSRPRIYYGDPTLTTCSRFQTQAIEADKLVISAKVCSDQPHKEDSKW